MNANQWGPPPPGYEPPEETVRFPFAPLSEDRPGGEHFYATNVPRTASQWGSEGKPYTFLAESPEAMEQARSVGAPRVMRGYNDEPRTETPSPMGAMPKGKATEETEDLGKFKSFWKTHVDENYKGNDPLVLNPAEEGIKAEEEARRRYAISLMAHDPGSVDYKKYEKLISDARNDAIKKAEWQRKIGEEDYKMSQDFFKKALTEQNKEARKTQTRANVQGAQVYTRNILSNPGAYELHPDDKAKIEADKNARPTRSRMKPQALKDVNRVRELAGLPPLIEKQIQIPMVESRNWGFFKTGQTPTTPEAGYEYIERHTGAAPAGAPSAQGTAKPVRYGTYNGRKVAQYSDGRVDYVQ